VVDAEPLQVVKQAGLDGPQAHWRLMGQRQERLAPGAGIVIHSAQQGLQAGDETMDLFPQRGGGLGGLFPRHPGLGAGAANDGPRQVAAGGVPAGPLRPVQVLLLRALPSRAARKVAGTLRVPSALRRQPHVFLIQFFRSLKLRADGTPPARGYPVPATLRIKLRRREQGGRVDVLGKNPVHVF